MDSKNFFGFGGRFLNAIFLQVETSLAPELPDALKGKDTFSFGALGFYDISCLFETTAITDIRFRDIPENTHGSDAVVCYAIKSDSYESPSLEAFLDQEKPVKSFIFLELDKLLYSEIDAIPSGLSACDTVIKKILSKDDKNVAFWGGFGSSELCLIYQTNKFKELWDFVKYLRNLKLEECFTCKSIENHLDLPIFLTTRTIPLIPIQETSFTDEEGNADIVFKCMSGFENIVYSYFDRDKFTVRGIWGHNDLSVTTNQKMPFNEILSSIEQCRKRFYKRGGQVRTQTIFWDSEFEPGGHPNHYGVDNSSHNLKINVPDTIAKVNPILASRLSAFNNKRRLYMNSYSYQTAVNRFTKFASYLANSLETLSEEDAPALEGIYEALDNAELALTQRTRKSLFTSNSSDTFLPFELGDGIFSNILATETLILSIYEAWAKSGNNNDGWYGFVTFSQSAGFMLRYGQVLFLPYSSLLSPLSDSGNWLTLTHEISHSIYNQLKLDVLLADSIKVAYSNSLPNFSEENSQGLRAFENEVFELFAHWFDYAHFYNADYESYMVNMWRSWRVLGSFEDNFLEFLFRSFAIYLMRDFAAIEEARQLQDQHENIGEYTTSDGPFIELLSSMWDEHIEKLKSLSDTYFNGSFGSIIDVQVSQSVTTRILIQLDDFIPILFVFNKLAERDQFKSFKENINQEYPGFDRHVEMIQAGKVIHDKIENPYMLLKRTAGHFLESDYLKSEQNKSLVYDVSLILSLKDQSALYDFKEARSD